MAYRVYDTEKKVWLKDNICLAPNDELFLIKKAVFGKSKTIEPLSHERYVCHKAIDLWDKNKVQVYEGDYIEAHVEENRSVIGLVAFAHELSAYVILCLDSNEFYTLGSEVSSEISVVGNVFDGHKEDKKDGQSALQEEKA